jgi:hypothetical protein
LALGLQPAAESRFAHIYQLKVSTNLDRKPFLFYKILRTGRFSCEYAQIYFYGCRFAIIIAADAFTIADKKTFSYAYIYC